MKRLLFILLSVALLSLTGCEDFGNLFGSTDDPEPTRQTQTIDGDNVQESPIARFTPDIRYDFRVDNSPSVTQDTLLVDQTDCLRRIEDPCPRIPDVPGERMRIHGVVISGVMYADTIQPLFE